MGKEEHYFQQALKHVQELHQVSVPVTNNVTNAPLQFKMLLKILPKSIPT